MHDIYVHVKPFFEGIHITKLDVLNKWAPLPLPLLAIEFGVSSFVALHLSEDLLYRDSADSELSCDRTMMPFRCRICLKGFRHPISLQLHKDLHTGQTQCPVCHRIFSRSYDMKTHLHRIHKAALIADTNKK